MWILYGLLAGISGGIGSIFAKKAAGELSDSWMRSFYFSLFGTILVLPFFLWEMSLPSGWKEIFLILLTGLIVVGSNYLIFKAYNTLSASTANVIGKLKLVWIALAGLIIFSQVLTLKNIIGILAIFAGVLVAADFKGWKASKEGVFSVVIATFLIAIYMSLLAVLGKTIEPLSLLWYVCAVPMLLNALLIPRLKNKIVATYSKTKWIFFNGLIAGMSNLLYILGVREEFTKFFFMMEASLIVILVAEYFYLKEKQRLFLRIFAITLAITGALLLR